MQRGPDNRRSGDELDRYLDSVLIGGREPVALVISDYDSAWPSRFARLEAGIRLALGDAALAVEHIGSTSVPRLAAKPIIDVLVVVADVDEESSYVTALEDAGFVLRVREAGHRMFRTPDRDAHIHVYPSGDQAITDYLDLRDWLRADESDRVLYEGVKRDLAQRPWSDMNHYAEAKSDVIQQVLGRARAWRGRTVTGIDFHDPANRRTYSDRDADASWREAVVALVDPRGAHVVDVGCGGGTYLRAWHDLGAATVTGVDSSAPILEAARESHGDLPGVSFQQGDAAASGLDAGRADIVFERALIHHVPDLAAVAGEAARVLRPGGILLVQDRTPDDVAQPGSADHPRGWLFDLFPRLVDVENGRRADASQVDAALASAGFVDRTATTLWEVRRRYADREDYLAEIAARTGRSILHELSDEELADLVQELRRRLPDGPLVERDRWTLWRAVRRA